MRQDPFRGFRFLVEFEGITSGGFTRVKGISREVKHESYREGGKVKKRTLLNLTHWPPNLLEGFKALLKGATVIPAPASPEVFYQIPVIRTREPTCAGRGT